MLLLSASLSKDDAWDILFGLLGLYLVLKALAILLLLAVLLRVAWLAWKLLRSPDRQQRYLGLALGLGATGVLLYQGSRYWLAQREQQRAATEHQAAEQQIDREVHARWVQQKRKDEQRDSLYFREMEAGKVDSSLFIPDPQAEARWQQAMAAHDSATQVRKRQYLRTHKLSN
jgi:hypothetical protein